MTDYTLSLTVYAEIPSKNVAFWEAAERMLAHARQELRLPMVRIRWFRRLDEISDNVEILNTFGHRIEEPYGYLQGKFDPARPGEIWIRANQTYSQKMLTICHECCHVRTHIAGCLCDIGEEELLSDEFAEKLVNSYREDQDCWLRHVMGHDYRAEELEAERKRNERLAAAGWGVSKKPAAKTPSTVKTPFDEADLQVAVKHLQAMEARALRDIQSSIRRADAAAKRKGVKLTDEELGKMIASIASVRLTPWSEWYCTCLAKRLREGN